MITFRIETTDGRVRYLEADRMYPDRNTDAFGGPTHYVFWPDGYGSPLLVLTAADVRSIRSDAARLRVPFWSRLRDLLNATA